MKELKTTRRTRIALIGGIITYGIKSSFYKYIHGRENIVKKHLSQKFEVEEIIYDKRINYDIHPYRVYIIDLLSLIKYYIKKLLEADMIITPGYGSILEPIIALIIAKLRNAPVLVKDTHWYWRRNLPSRVFWYIYYHLMKHFNGILVPGKASYRFWREYGFRRVYIVHYYWLEALTGECSKIPSELREVKNRHDIVFLYLGRIIKKRGIDLIVKAFHKYVENTGGNPLLIIGGAGEYLDDVKKLIRELNLEDKTLLITPVPEGVKPCLYDIADVFIYTPILTQIPEEWPIPPLEAMLHRKPVIISNICGSIPDLYPGVYVVKWGSTDEIYKAMKKLTDKKYREMLGSIGFRIASSITPLKVYIELLKALKESIRES